MAVVVSCVGVERLLHCYGEWLNSSDPRIPESLCGALDRIGMDPDAFEVAPPPLKKAIRTLASAWSDASHLVEPGDLAAEMPHTVWRAIDALEDAHAAWIRSQVPEIESIQELRTQRVPDRQICRIYGFILSNGMEDLDKLAEEIAEPGRHTGNGWMAPMRKRKLDAASEIATTATQRRERRREIVSPKPSATEADLPDLIAQGVSARQIGVMTGLTVDEVVHTCERLSLPIPSLEYTALQATRGAYDHKLLEAQERAMDAELARPTRPSTQRVHREASEAADASEAAERSQNASEATEAPEPSEPAGTRQGTPQTPETARPMPTHLLGDIVKLTADGMQPGQIARSLRKAGHAITAAEVRKVIAKS